jgi:hypothetical protein
MSDDFDAVRRMRPDRVQPDDPADPTVFEREKEKLMEAIAHLEPGKNTFDLPDIVPRLAYENEYEALAYLERVFQLHEIREARTEFEDHR